MLVAYYSQGCDTADVFDQLKISKMDSYKKHLNSHHVIYLDMKAFYQETHQVAKMLEMINERVCDELVNAFPDVRYFNKKRLSRVLTDINSQKLISFIFIMDHYNCMFEEKPYDLEGHKLYLFFLQALLRDGPYVALAYMTGVMPMKRQSICNMFEEVSMLQSGPFAPYMGFTEMDMNELCPDQEIKTKLKEWYGGYHMNDQVMLYSPASVMQALKYHQYKCYRNDVLNMCFDIVGVNNVMDRLLVGCTMEIMTLSFENDRVSLHSIDDVLTLFIHLGYLTYDYKKGCSIPNKEAYLALKQEK